MNKMVDTHCHLYDEQYDLDRELVVQRALEAGVDKIYMPNIDDNSIIPMLKVEQKFPHVCHAMMGLHPCYVQEKYIEQLGAIEAQLSRRDYCAIGEIGIDLYWKQDNLRQQQEVFRVQVQWAKELRKPIIIHARESLSHILEIVESENDDNLTGIFHCFGGNNDEADRIEQLGGFKLGIGGVLTFKNSNLAHVLKKVDLPRLVLETDGPYLAPTPYRGKRNEPGYVKLIASCLAEIYGTTADEVARITSANADSIYKPVLSAP